MTTLRLYSFFHLNLAFSSMEEEHRPTVVSSCYRPLLALARDARQPLGIEASGYTLEQISEIDPRCMEDIRTLCTTGRCTFVGSGYVQLIGPLVPPEVNRANLSVGQECYEALLGFRPRIALVNEQTYSAGMVRHYLDAGYEAIIMEWDNPAAAHPEWDKELRYHPQYACDQHGRRIPLLWNHSIPFQKFQRYAHGELALDDLVAYLAGHRSDQPRSLCLYGNDAEVFDFRPGRYRDEAATGAGSEWDRVGELYASLRDDPRFEIASLEQVLGQLGQAGTGHALSLETPDQPVPTKKQYKYNPTRWAVSGRNDLGVNTACWRIYDALLREGVPDTDEAWKELCCLWGSDFRTHITDRRWAAYLDRLEALEDRVCGRTPSAPRKSTGVPHPGAGNRYLELATPHVRVRLDTRKGLAIDGLSFPRAAGPDPLVGTIPHGHFDDIGWGADFFSGHLVFELPGQPKVTDLAPVHPAVTDRDGAPWIAVSGTAETPLGPVTKTLRLHRDVPRLDLTYLLHWDRLPPGSLRLGTVTLLPDALDRESLFYRTHNGGFEPETFRVDGNPVDHGRPVSFLVSARQALGVTSGTVELGDRRCCLRVSADKTRAAVVGMISHHRVDGTAFFRLAFSAREMDETSRPVRLPDRFAVRSFAFSIEVPAEKTASPP